MVFMTRPMMTPMTPMTETWHTNTVTVCSKSQGSWDQIVIDPKKIIHIFYPEQNLEAGVDNPWRLQTHAEAEKEPRCGGAPVSGGHGLETGEEDTASCQPDDDCVSQGGVPEMRFKIPEEESLQHKSQNIDIACTLFGK